MPKNSSKKPNQDITIDIEEGPFDFAPKRGITGSTATICNSCCCANAAGSVGLLVGGSIWGTSRIWPFLKSVENVIGTIPTAVLTIGAPSIIPGAAACVLYCCCGVVITALCINQKNYHKPSRKGYQPLGTGADDSDALLDDEQVSAEGEQGGYQATSALDAQEEMLPPNLAKIMEQINELTQDLILTIFNKDSEALEYKDVIMTKLNDILDIEECSEEAVNEIHQKFRNIILKNCEDKIKTDYRKDDPALNDWVTTNITNPFDEIKAYIKANWNMSHATMLPFDSFTQFRSETSRTLVIPPALPEGRTNHS